MKEDGAQRFSDQVVRIVTWLADDHEIKDPAHRGDLVRPVRSQRFEMGGQVTGVGRLFQSNGVHFGSDVVE